MCTAQQDHSSGVWILAYAQVMAELRSRMLDLLRAEQDPRALGNGAVFDTYKYVAGRAKAYDTWLKAQPIKRNDE